MDKNILAAIEKDSTIVMKLAPAATQVWGLVEQLQAANTNQAKAGVVADFFDLKAKQGISDADVAALLRQYASA